MPTPKIDIPMDRLADFCRRWKIVELSLFGSVLRDDFGPDSDVDVMVVFSPDSRWTLLNFARMHRELEGIFGRSVDLVTRRAVEGSRNAHRRRAILSSAEVVYAA